MAMAARPPSTRCSRPLPVAGSLHELSPPHPSYSVEVVVEVRVTEVARAEVVGARVVLVGTVVTGGSVVGGGRAVGGVVGTVGGTGAHVESGFT